MRTGLKSLAEAFRILGYDKINDRVQILENHDLWSHAIQNKATKENFRKGLQGAQVVMGLPTFVFWEQILEAFPDAKVVLTTRDEAAWFRSVQEAKEQLDTEAPAAPLRSGPMLRMIERWMLPSYTKLCDVLRFSWAAALGISFFGDGELNAHVTCGMFRKHNLYVQDRVPKEQLLVMDVRQGWGPLCAFLGVEKPEEPFPAVLDVPYFTLADMGKRHKSRHEGSGRLEEGEARVLQQAMMQELRRAVVLLAGAVLLLFCLLLTPLLRETPGFLVVLLMTVAVHISASVWIALRYILRRMPMTLALPAALKIIFVSVGINVIYLVYGILKEELVTVTHMPSIYIVLASRMMAVFVGLAGVGFTRGLHLEAGKSILGAPIKDFAAFSVANELSTWAGYEMLKYVSFAVQVMAKSTTVLPSMLMGRALSGTRYSIKEWVKALILVVAVAVMQLDEDTGSGKRKHKGVEASTDASWLSALLSPKLQMGLLLLCVYFFFDSFCSQYQTRMNKRYSDMSHYQMMLGGSLFAVFFEGLMMLGSAWMRGGMPAMPLHGGALTKICWLSLTAAVGQVFIYYTIKEFGGVVLAWIMTTRKVISVAFSFIWFGHPFTWLKLVCISMVFGMLILGQVFKSKKGGPAGGRRPSTSGPAGATGRKGSTPSASLKLPACRRTRLSSITDLTSPFYRSMSFSEASTSATSGESEEENPTASSDPATPVKGQRPLGLIPEAADNKKTS